MHTLSVSIHSHIHTLRSLNYIQGPCQHPVSYVLLIILYYYFCSYSFCCFRVFLYMIMLYYLLFMSHVSDCLVVFFSFAFVFYLIYWQIATYMFSGYHQVLYQTYIFTVSLSSSINSGILD